MRLEVAVSAQRFRDVARPPVLRPQLHRFEVVNVNGIEEHESNGGQAAVNFEGMSRQYDSFRYDSRRVRIEEHSRGDQIGSLRVCGILPQKRARYVPKTAGAIYRRYARLA